MTVRVKICGITRYADALAAVELGADALGFNFWPGSKRYIEPSKAARIIDKLPPFVSTVGVFVNAPEEDVVRSAAQSVVSAVQLHGDETPAFAAKLKLPVIKAIRVDSRAALGAMRLYDVDAFLLDAPSAGFGGSGKTFDWSWAKGLPKRYPVLLAGGLAPANVARAVRAVRPYAVDVASGVEDAPGIKNLRAMARFITAAKEA